MTRDRGLPFSTSTSQLLRSEQVGEDRSGAMGRGMLAGYRYAEDNRHDRANLGRIARARSAPDVIVSLEPVEIPAHEPTDAVAFWSGFAHGVQRYLLEERHHREQDAPGSPGVA